MHLRLSDAVQSRYDTTSDQAARLKRSWTRIPMSPIILPGAGIPVLIDQVESVDARQIFYTKVTEKTPAQVKRRHHIYVALFLASTIPHRQLIRS